MHAYPYLRRALGLAAGLLTAACDNPTREATSPEISEAAQGNGAASHYRTRGPYAQLDFSTVNGSVFRLVSVYVSGSAAPDKAFLAYSVWDCDNTTFECQAVEEGDGLIPRSDLIQRGRHLYLRANTAEPSPDFYVYAGSGGPINVTWTELSAYSSRSNSHYRYESDYFLQQYHTINASSAAVAEGSIIGVEVVLGDGSAGMGTSQSGEIDIIRKP